MTVKVKYFSNVSHLSVLLICLVFGQGCLSAYYAWNWFPSWTTLKDISFWSIHCNLSQTYITRSATHFFSHNPWDNLDVFYRFALNQWQFAGGFLNQRKSEKKWELGSRRQKHVPEGLVTLGEELLSDR